MRHQNRVDTVAAIINGQLRRNLNYHSPTELYHCLLRGWGNYDTIGDVMSMFEDLDKWIRMRLRSKVIQLHATTLSNSKMPNRVLVSLGLASLSDLRRQHLSPA